MGARVAGLLKGLKRNCIFLMGEIQ